MHLSTFGFTKCILSKVAVQGVEHADYCCKIVHKHFTKLINYFHYAGPLQNCFQGPRHMQVKYACVCATATKMVPTCPGPHLPVGWFVGLHVQDGGYPTLLRLFDQSILLIFCNWREHEQTPHNHHQW